MSTAIQTIEPDEPTLTDNPKPPTQNAEPSRSVSGAMANSTTPSDAEAGTVALLRCPVRNLDTSTYHRRRAQRPRRYISSGARFQTGNPKGIFSFISCESVCTSRRPPRLVPLPHSRHSDLRPLRFFHGQLCRLRLSNLYSFPVNHSFLPLTDRNSRRPSRHGLLELPGASFGFFDKPARPAHLFTFRTSLGGLLLVYVFGTRFASFIFRVGGLKNDGRRTGGRQRRELLDFRK